MFSGEPSGECCLSTMFSLSGECVSDKTGKTTVGTLKDPDSRSYVYVYIYMYISPSFTSIVDFRFFYSKVKSKAILDY